MNEIMKHLELTVMVFLLGTSTSLLAANEPTIEDSAQVLTIETPVHAVYQNSAIRVRVKSIDETSGDISSTFGDLGVKIVREESMKTGSVTESTWHITVPKGNMETFTKKVKESSAELLSIGANYEDKIAQVKELGLRIEYREQTIEELSKLAEKAGKVSERIEARLALRNLEEELEQLIVQRDQLLQDAELVHASVTFVEDPNIPLVVETPSFTEELGAAFWAGIDNLKASLLLIVTYWPISLFALIALIYFSLALRHSRKESKRLRKQQEFEKELRQQAHMI